ncbi:hypothetical protein CBM2599_A10356 [Cupriavidus taiwanensis]|nr:hypothetical protein CBM2599_A10356 [Cupriavidus taiwanensis]
MIRRRAQYKTEKEHHEEIGHRPRSRQPVGRFGFRTILRHPVRHRRPEHPLPDERERQQ